RSPCACSRRRWASPTTARRSTRRSTPISSGGRRWRRWPHSGAGPHSAARWAAPRGKSRGMRSRWPHRRRTGSFPAPLKGGSRTRRRRSRSILFVPELPELEAFVIAQRDALTAAPIAAIPVAHFATVKTIDPPIASLAGQRSPSLGRRAKRILIEAEDGDRLVLHLMSAGKLVVGGKRTRSA